MQIADEFLTVAELAARWKKKPEAVYWMRSRGQGPPAVRAGNELRFRLDEVRSWEDAQAARDARRVGGSPVVPGSNVTPASGATCPDAQAPRVQRREHPWGDSRRAADGTPRP